MERKTFKFISMAFVAAVMGMGLTACSSDDNNDPKQEPATGESDVTAESVFTNGLPKSTDGMNFTYNDKGQLTSINDGGAKVTLEYGVGNVAKSGVMKAAAVAGEKVRMTVVDDGEKQYFVMTLNAQGYVSHCDETESDGEKETWDFEYNKEGQLTKMTRSEGGNEVTTLTYENGNAVKTTLYSPEDGTDVTTIKYSATVNKGSVMLFDATLDVDMDEMRYAYYAGLLGKATKNLPESSEDIDSDGSKWTSTFTWTFNDNQMPVKMVLTDNGYHNETYTFEW